MKTQETVWIMCPDCGQETKITLWPVIPAKTIGPTERCHPEEGGEIDPDTCSCGRVFSYEEVAEVAHDEEEGAREAYWEGKIEEYQIEKAYGTND